MTMTRNAAAVLALGLVAALPATADEPQQSGMASGNTQIAPRQNVVSETGDQIRANDAMGREVRSSDNKPIGKTSDLFVGAKSGTVELVGIDRSGKNIVVPWSSLRWEAKPAPHFVAQLASDQLGNGTEPQAAKKSGDYLDVKSRLLGHALKHDGKEVGTLRDLVLSFGDGRIVAALVDAGGGEAYAVPWQKAQIAAAQDGDALTTALSHDEIAKNPQFATKAPQATQPENASGTSGKTQPDTSLGTSTERFTPAPDTRRR
jgi:sporulation protein YlmC with PRC-barrel domain